MPLTEKQREWILTYTAKRREGVFPKASRFSFEKLTDDGKAAQDNLDAMESFQRRAEKAERLLAKLQSLHLQGSLLAGFQQELTAIQEKAERGDFVGAKTDITELKTRLGKAVVAQAKVVEKRDKGAKDLVSAVSSAREALAKVAALRGVSAMELYKTTAGLVEEAGAVLGRVRAGEGVSESDQLNAIAVLRPVAGNCADLQEASVKARELAHQEVVAIKAWGKLLRRYEPEVQDLYRLAGAGDRAQVVNAIEAVARLRPLAQRHIDGGQGAGGYVAAVEEMKDWEVLAAAARVASLLTTLRWVNSDLKELTVQVQSALESLRAQATEVQVALLEDELRTLTSGPETDDADRELRDLLRRVEQERERLTAIHLEVARQIVEWGALLDHGVMPPRSARRLRLRLEAAMELGADRYWEDAQAACTRGLLDTQSLIDRTREHHEAWSQASQRLTEARALCVEMLLWIPAAFDARNLLDDVKAVRELYERDEQVELALGAYNKAKISERYEALLRRVTDEEMPRGLDVQMFHRAYTSGTRTLADEGQRVMGSIEQLKAAVAERGKQLTPVFLARHAAVVVPWESLATEPPPDPLSALPDILEACQKEYARLEGNVQAALLPEGLVKVLQSCGPAGEPERLERIEAALEVLVRIKSPQVADLQRRRDEARSSRRKPKPDLEALERVAVEAEELVRQSREQLDPKKKQVLKDQAEVSQILKQREVPRDFRPYLEKLAEESEDIARLANSDDPALVSAATERLVALRQKVERQEDHTKVEEVYRRIANTLGEDDLVKEMPETHARLHTALKEAIHKATRADVVTGLGLLQPLEKDVNLAYEAAKGHVALVKNLKASHELAVKRFGELQRGQTLRTGSIDFYAKAFEAKQKAIEALLKKESGVAEAGKKLEALHKELDAFPTDNLGIQQQESAAAEIARRNKDRARLLQAEVAELKESVLLPLEVAAKKDKSIDKALLKNIRKQLHNAKKMMVDVSPLLEASNAVYEEVRKIVASSRESLERLLEQEGSSRIKVKGDLRKAGAHWAKQSLAFANTLRQVARGIGEESATDLNPEVVEQGKKAEALLRSLAGLFPASAFDRPFALLLAPFDPEDPPTRERKDAREAALRTMRRLRGLLLRHPLLKKLANKKNPFEGQKILNATAMVRAALKRVEREVLITA